MKSVFNLLSMLVLAVAVTGFAPLYPASRSVSIGSSTLLQSTRNAIQDEEDKYLALAMQGAARPEIIYILMYNPGTNQEGIHTVEYPRGSETDLLLAFESIEDCNSLANAIRSNPEWTQEPIPTPTGLQQMETACQQMGIPIQVVPAQSS